MKLFLSYLLLPFFTLAQTNFSGTITTKNAATKIPYATVSLIKENIGTNADEYGAFSLQSIRRIPNDSLMISSVGYETLKLSIDNLPANMQFELIAKETTLKEFIVNTKRKFTSTTLNQASNCGSNYQASNGQMSQIAQHFHAAVDNALLSEVEICKYGIAIIDPNKTIFRLRIYGMDTSSGRPSRDLVDSIIEIKAEGRHVVVNLEKYNIHIPSKDFFVAIEWLKIPYNGYREKTKINGTVVSNTTYYPLIAFKERGRKNFTAPQAHEVWMQMYTGKWWPLDGVSKLMIAATIKY